MYFTVPNDSENRSAVNLTSALATVPIALVLLLALSVATCWATAQRASDIDAGSFQWASPSRVHDVADISDDASEESEDEDGEPEEGESDVDE